jgi:hypothetical protein
MWVKKGGLYSMATELGATVKDKITGFKGVVTGRVEYISGCNQVLVTPSIKADGDLNDARWFDEDRVELQPDPVISLTITSPGADSPAPIR